MTAEHLQILKTADTEVVRITATDGETFTAKVIHVFDQESGPDLFYELVATSRPEQYANRDNVGGYSIPLNQIESVELIIAPPAIKETH